LFCFHSQDFLIIRLSRVFCSCLFVFLEINLVFFKFCIWVLPFAPRFVTAVLLLVVVVVVVVVVVGTALYISVRLTCMRDCNNNFKYLGHLMKHRICQKRLRSVERLESHIRQEKDNIPLPKSSKCSPRFQEVSKLLLMEEKMLQWKHSPV